MLPMNAVYKGSFRDLGEALDPQCQLLCVVTYLFDVQKVFDTEGHGTTVYWGVVIQAAIVSHIGSHCKGYWLYLQVKSHQCRSENYRTQGKNVLKMML